LHTSGDHRSVTARDRLRRLLPRSSRVQATLLVLAAVLAFLLAFGLGRGSGAERAPLRTATPLVPRSQAVEISGLPAARALPALRPQAVRRKPPATKPPAKPAVVQPPAAPARPATPTAPRPPSAPARPAQRPVVIVGEG
jgi:hypothetical protein